MANTAKQHVQSAQADWAGVFTLDDFLIPSRKTEVAEVTSAIATVVMDLATVGDMAVQSDATEIEVLSTTDEQMESAEGDFMEQILKAWGSESNDIDTEYHKVSWPFISPDDFRPSTNVEQRIHDNIEAIKLVKQLSQESRQPNEGEMATLLRYSGWGGASRVFSPDGSQPHALSDLRNQLQAVTTQDEYAAMQSSVNTAFYTDPCVVRALWAIVQRLGFRGGRIIEPAAGTGHILAGMPTEISKKSEVTAVELDSITAQMLKGMFEPLGAQVHACGLEDAKVPSGFYDLCIGNVPFGKYRTNDTSKAPYAEWNIHNWMIGKSVDLVRPGGLIVLITTSSTLDSKKDDHRKWVSAHAELLTAIRLPTMAFESFAGTKAVTDILVLKRREIPDYLAGSEWMERKVVPNAMFKAGMDNTRWVYNKTYGRSMQMKAEINGIYTRHPERVIGKMDWISGQHGDKAMPVFDGNVEELGEQLIRVIETAIPEGIYVEHSNQSSQAPMSALVRHANHEQAMAGSFVMHQGSICISEGDELLDVDSLYQGTARKRVLGMMDIRDAANAVVECQVKSDDDAELAALQKKLNQVYDSFVAKMGYLCTTANARVMRSDPSWPLMLALEYWDEDEGVAHKADIFNKRTVGKVSLPDRVDTAKDAMLISLALYGRIVLKDMALRTGKPVMEVVKELKAHGTAFRDPAKGCWVPADEYLSGHIREKIQQAKVAGAAYAENIPALETVIPQDLGPAEVEARLGAPWIPVDVVKEFATYLVNDKNNAVTVSYDVNTATWSVGSTSYSLDWVGERSLQVVKWGTAARCALKLIEGALNQQPPTVTTTIDGKSVTDPVATLAAREKWQAIRDEFRNWVYKDDARRDKLLRIYNDTFNQVVQRRFDGSHLHLPGLSAQVVPYPHQKDAVWRILVNGNTLLAHCVGAGKTLTMIAAGMELRRLGKARKVVHVVPNHLLSDYCGEFLRYYPQARVLMASKEDFASEKRKTFVARIAISDVDAVVMTQSTFERLMPSPAVQQRFIDQQLAEARAAMARCDDRNAKRTVKEIERRMKEYEAKIRRLVEAKGEDNAVWFEELGCDWLMFDEAHALKNLAKTTKMPRIAGLPSSASQRAFDAWMKTRLIMEERGGREEGVVFATATPITNSVAEMHTMQMFVQPVTLKRYGVYEFDAWAASFGESVTGIELSPDGSGFRTNTRFAKFVNLPELMGIARGAFDVRTKRMLNLPSPKIVGGKPQVVVIEPSATLKEITDQLVERADAVRSRRVEPKEDNMLAITNDGRRAALDVRLFNSSFAADPDNKLMAVAKNVFRIWEEGRAEKTTQIVFCDLGTPGSPGFSVYEELRSLLIGHGIPESQIAFIHDHDSDAAKAKLFKKMRDGSVRILFGSTKKLGTGTNVQRLLKAVHQVDQPWVPADVEQRDGRADRQGNLNESIELYRYVTSGSFDAYSWNLLDVKARFIEQVMTAEQGLRTVEDISMTALSYAEIKAIASGNPLVMEKATVDANVQKLALKLDHWEQDRWRMGHRQVELDRRLAWIDANMAQVEEVAKRASLVDQMTPCQANLSRVKQSMVGFSGPQALGAAFRGAAKGLSGSLEFAELGGFVLEAERTYMGAFLNVLDRVSGHRESVDRPNMGDIEGVGNAILTSIAYLAEMPGLLRLEYGRKADEKAAVSKLLQEEFQFREELEAARKRQREIEALLDLDKATEGSQAMGEEAATQ